MIYVDQETFDIYLTRGDSAEIPFSVTKNGEPYDYSNDLVQFTVKKNTLTEEIVIQKQITGPAVIFEPSDTEKLDYSSLVYDIQIITPDDKVYTVVGPSNFTLTEEVNFRVVYGSIIERVGDDS
jgi:hypothetical protein